MEHNVMLNTSMCANREDFRRVIYENFVNEEPGRDGETSFYTYTVETLADRSTVYLRRPAPLNKGIDFTVNASGYTFHVGSRMMHRPTHGNIIEALAQMKTMNTNLFSLEVTPVLQLIYQASPMADGGYHVDGFEDSPYPIEVLLKLLKWLFIEQDVTYWNKSGRAMLFLGLSERGLV